VSCAIGRFIWRRLVAARADELLKTQPVIQLLFGLRITHAGEMLQQNDP
jgi:hypothetical protein